MISIKRVHPPRENYESLVNGTSSGALPRYGVAWVPAARLCRGSSAEKARTVLKRRCRERYRLIDGLRRVDLLRNKARSVGRASDEAHSHVRAGDWMVHHVILRLVGAPIALWFR